MSDPIAEETVEVARPTTVGAMLRAARETQGLTSQDMAVALRIRQQYLEAIESGRYSILPGATYAVGFVRAYAEYLGLDADETVRRLKQETAGGLGERSELVFPSPVSEGRVPAGAVLFLALILAGGAYGAWYYMSSKERGLAELVPALPDQLTTMLRDPGPQTEKPVEDGKVEDVKADVIPSPEAEDQEPAGAPIPPKPPVLVENIPAAAPVKPDAPAATPPKPTPGTAATPVLTGMGGTPSMTGMGATPPKPGETAPTGMAAVTPKPTEPAKPGAPVKPGETPKPPASATPPKPGDTAMTGMTGMAATPGETPKPPASATPPKPGETPKPPASATPPTESQTATAPPPVPNEPARGGRAFGELGASRVTLNATEDCWIQVRDGDGKLLLTRLLRKGDSYSVPNQPGMSLMTGSAGALSISVDGKKAPPLGALGEVRRDIKLDPDKLAGG